MNPEMEFKEAVEKKDKVQADELLFRNQIGNPDLLWLYVETFEQRLPESSEPILLKGPHDVWRYILSGVKDRFPEYEKIIEEDPYTYTLYTNFLKKINKYDEYLGDQTKTKEKVDISDLLRHPEKINDVFRNVLDKGDKELAKKLLPYVDPFFYYKYLEQFGERVPLELESKLFGLSDFSKGGYDYVNVISGKDLYDSFS